MNTERSQKPLERLRILFILIALFGVLMIVRLFVVMVVHHEEYAVIAADMQGMMARVTPKRGLLYWQDVPRRITYPIALNKDTYTVFADTRQLTTNADREKTADALFDIVGGEETVKAEFLSVLAKENDPYEPLIPKVDEALAERIREEQILGIGLERHPERFYPEKELVSQTLGFVGKNDAGEPVGRYGVEGYFNDVLSGSGGFLEGVRSASGRLIPLAGRSFTPVEDGADIVLTLDRTLQYRACERLRAAAIEYQAESASLIMMNPNTGAILALCNTPEFDPNTYSKVESVSLYNNNSIFTPYEPGSIFKPIAMAAAIEEGLVSPETHFFDTGLREGVCEKPIRNAGNKAYQSQTMIGVLDNSINTGMVWVAEKLGRERLKTYIEQFGFGTKTGIALDTEAAGNIDSLSLNPKRAFDCYAATASFGQGITVTPLQMVVAYSAIANGGVLMAPRIVSEIRYTDGRVEEVKPKEIKRVISTRASALMKSMLVSVVDQGHGKPAKANGYLVAGKTGTAQIAGPGGYIQDIYNHSFVGFAPAENPAFVMIVKFEKPAVEFSASTAAPVFGDIAQFALQYLEIPPTR
jgi:cell division protein FtsI/penicillin-binding protein 2